MMAPAGNRGFTLVELVISISLASLVLVALLYAWSLNAKRSADVTWQARTAYIGQTYLEEILTKRFDENASSDGLLPCGTGTFGTQTMPACSGAASFGVVPGSSPLRSRDGELRADFDDVDDYHNLNEVPLSLLDSLFAGNANPYGAYQVSVAVAYDTGHIGTASMVKRITVTVTPPGEAPVRFAAYKGNY